MNNEATAAAAAFILSADMHRAPNAYMIDAARRYAADLPIFVVTVTAASESHPVESFAMVAATDADTARVAAVAHYCDELYAGDWKIAAVDAR